MLALAVAAMFELPEEIGKPALEAATPVSWLPLPMKKLPDPTVILPTAEIVVPTVSAPFTAMVLAVITLAVDKILVHELVALEYWYDTWFTTVTCPFVGDTGKAIISPVGLIHYLCRIKLFNF